MAAQEFARHLSEIGLADHVIIRGPAFKRFDNPHKAVEMLASILRWAKASSKKNKKPVILIFDEAETLFADREQPEFATKLTSDLVTTMTSFLSSAISNDVMFILSTNFPGRIDKALRNRIAKVNRVRFTVPGQKQREELLKLYLDQNFTELGFTIAPAVFKNLKTYAEKLDHLVGRDIQALTAQPLYTMLSKGKTELTPDLLEAAIAESVKKEDLSAY
jgi:SpoVK/Ycf46/Vps4 family AAA+-type ATPase